MEEAKKLKHYGQHYFTGLATSNNHRIGKKIDPLETVLSPVGHARSGQGEHVCKTDHQKCLKRSLGGWSPDHHPLKKLFSSNNFYHSKLFIPTISHFPGHFKDHYFLEGFHEYTSRSFPPYRDHQTILQLLDTILHSSLMVSWVALSLWLQWKEFGQEQGLIIPLITR